MVRYLKILFFLLAILPLNSDEGIKNILVIHSYSPSYKWTEDMHQGIRSVFEENVSQVITSIEFLDSKFHYNEDYETKIAEILNEKYADYPFDGIITTDNNALNFIIQYGPQLFPDVPVVCSGINGEAPDTQGSSVVNILLERADHRETLRQALEIFPETKKIHVIVDSSLSGELISGEIPEAFDYLNSDVELEFIRGFEFNQLLRKISHIPSGELLYLIPYFQDGKGEYFSQGRAEEAISQAASVPVMTSWDYQKDTGVLGGNLLNSFEIGRKAAANLSAYLEGEDLPLIDTTQQDDSYDTYDYQVMRRYNISRRQLPKGAVLINRLPSFLEEYRLVLIPALLIISALLAFIYLLLSYIHNQREIHQKNRELIQMTEEFMETQREIIIRLGDVIERRSHETGEHINRVSEISGFLAEKLGMAPLEIEVLKAASPLHDIGKIGIPDSILNSNKKLTPEEFEIMKQHTLIGRDILSSSTRDIFVIARKIAHRHHERWDGNGYPDGLQGKEIPLVARITMVADIYDALSNERSYKAKWDKEKVRAYFRDGKGTFFDPKLADVFLEHFDEISRRF